MVTILMSWKDDSLIFCKKILLLTLLWVSELEAEINICNEFVDEIRDNIMNTDIVSLVRRSLYHAPIQPIHVGHVPPTL